MVKHALFHGPLVLVACHLHAADPVGQWNHLALDAVRFANTPPPAAARQPAIVFAALLDAVNGLGGRVFVTNGE